MRPSQKSSRPRGRGGRKPNGNSINRVYESAGPEGKVRGTPQQIIDKYLTLARDAQTSGDRVVSENFLQHAEHYQRILIEAMGARQERRDGGYGDQDQPDVEMSDEFDPDESQESPQAAPARADDGRQHGGRRREAGRDDGGNRGDASGRSDARESRDSEVRGLTTIETGDGDTGSLLVDAEELSASQPRRRPRRRKPEDAPAAPATAEAEPQPE